MIYKGIVKVCYNSEEEFKNGVMVSANDYVEAAEKLQDFFGNYTNYDRNGIVELNIEVWIDSDVISYPIMESADEIIWDGFVKRIDEENYW